MRSGAKLRVAMRSGAEIWTGAADPGWQSIREVVGFYNHLVITSAAQLHVQVEVFSSTASPLPKQHTYQVQVLQKTKKKKKTCSVFVD